MIGTSAPPADDDRVELKPAAPGFHQFRHDVLGVLPQGFVPPVRQGSIDRADCESAGADRLIDPIGRELDVERDLEPLLDGV